MRDAYGGIMNIVFLVVFFVLVEGILGFIVGYTKAFRAKNLIISTIEEYEASGCFNNDKSGGTACINKIKERSQKIGYGPTAINCPNDSNGGNVANMFCWERHDVDRTNYSGERPYIYRITTQVDITFPLIDKVLGFNFFQVSGDTRIIDHQVDS